MLCTSCGLEESLVHAIPKRSSSLPLRICTYVSLKSFISVLAKSLQINRETKDVVLEIVLTIHFAQVKVWGFQLEIKSKLKAIQASI